MKDVLHFIVQSHNNNTMWHCLKYLFKIKFSLEINEWDINMFALMSVLSGNGSYVCSASLAIQTLFNLV